MMPGNGCSRGIEMYYTLLTLGQAFGLIVAICAATWIMAIILENIF
jgi:hypothetical protein